MKAVLAAASWLAALYLASAQNASSVGSNPVQLALQGRFSPGLGSQGYATLPQTFSWPASSVYARFDRTSSVQISILARPSEGNVSFAINWFRFFVDGNAAADGFTTYNQLYLNVTLNTSTSAHVLRVAKMNEGAKGEAVLQSILLDGSGRFLSPAGLPSTASNRRILVLGDSYAVGYGDAGAVIPRTCQPTAQQLAPEFLATCSGLKIQDSRECAALWRIYNQNSLEAFGPKLAEAFSADYQVIATSGSGMVGYSFAAEANPGLDLEQLEVVLPSNEAMMNRSIYSDPSSQYSLDQWIPQVVLIASGTNDWHSVPPIYSLEDWLSDATAFLRQVSTVLRQPAIIIQAWPPEQQLAGAMNTEDGNGINQTLQYIQAMPSLYTEAIRQRIPNVHYVQIDTSDYDNPYAWCDGHPSAVAHRAVAKQLASFLPAVLPDWNTSQPVNLTVDQQAIRPSTALYASVPVGSAG